MKTSIKLSIIIPCYNVEEKVLKRCLYSLLFIEKYMEYEIIIVDDGSERNQITEWAAKWNNPRIKVFRQSNMGPGGARNTGIEHSCGEYITFVDADDYILYGPYTLLIKVLEEKNPDILAHGCNICYEGSATRFLLENDIQKFCYLYIIRRNTLKDIRFTPYIYHENEEFCTRLHLTRAHLVTVNYSAYYFNYRAESILHSQEIAILKKRFSDYITILNNLISLELPQTRQMALNKCLDLMGMEYIISLMCYAKGHSFFNEALSQLENLNLYPLPFRWHGTKYTVIMLATHIPLLYNIIAPVVNILYKIKKWSNRKKSGLCACLP